MSEKEFLYQMRLKIFQEADKKEIPIVLLCKKHHMSRKWFYKWKKRRERLHSSIGYHSPEEYEKMTMVA